MSKVVKIIAIGVGFLALLFVVVAGIAIAVIDPNDFRDDIEELAEQHIDRELTFSGDINLSLFPWIGVQVGAVSLSNPPGFPSDTFAQMESIDLKLSIMSLFSGAIVVDTVRLNGLTANLEVNQRGVNNWSSLMKASPDQQPQQKSEPAEEAEEPSSLPDLTVQGVEIVDAALSWRDEQAGSHYQISNFQLITGTVALGQPLSLSIDFDVSGNQPQLSGTVALKATANADIDRGQFDLDLSKLAVNLNGESLPNGVLALTLSSHISGTPKQVSMTDLLVAVDDVRLTGSADVMLDDSQKIDFSVAIDELDLDKFLPTSTPVAAETPKPDAPSAAVPLDLKSMLSPLDTLNLAGSLQVGLLKVKNVTSTDINVGVEAKNGKLTVSPMNLTLYTGTLAGKLVVDNQGAVPRIQVEQKLNGVAIRPLLQDFADTDKISGATNASVSINTRGNNIEQLTRGLNGVVDFDLQNGQIKDINVDRAICLARNGLKTVQKKTTEVCPENPNTDFATLAGNAVITDGVVNNKSIAVEQVRKGGAARLAIKGYGTVDLNTQRLDYHIRAAKLEASPQDATQFVVQGNEVPVRIRGTFADFKVRPELSDAMKEKLDEKKQESEEKLKGKLIKELEDDPGDSESDKKKKALFKQLFN